MNDLKTRENHFCFLFRNERIHPSSSLISCRFVPLLVCLASRIACCIMTDVRLVSSLGLDLSSECLFHVCLFMSNTRACPVYRPAQTLRCEVIISAVNTETEEMLYCVNQLIETLSSHLMGFLWFVSRSDHSCVSCDFK